MNRSRRMVVAVAASVGLIASGAAASAHETPPPALLGTLSDDLARLPQTATYSLSAPLAAALGGSTASVASLARLAGARPAIPGEKTPPVGTTLLWPAMDTVHTVGPVGIYLKQYTLRGVGDHIEVWVASGKDGTSDGTAFPANDCRNVVAGSTDVTDSQVKGLIDEFDHNMYPKETKAFSTPPDRSGTATIPGLTAAGLNFAGDGGHTVTLVDNVRDENFYEFPKNKSYIAGFYAPIFNQLTDRNVMTIDAFDWAHRTGNNPKDEPNSDLCKSRPARPRQYEATFAHEWQHLLHQYRDGDESLWVNEGLSMYAESLVGYTDTTRTVRQRRAQSQLLCFQGFGNVKGPSNQNPNPCGGPQNSLTSWGDEGQGSEILADYGNAWAFMLYLADRFGRGVIGGLHRDGKAQGLAGLQDQLDAHAKGVKAEDVLHDYQLMNLVDRYLDERAMVAGGKRPELTARELHSTLNLSEPAAYEAAGAAPNGADYLRLNAADLKSLRFAGEHEVIAPSGESSDPTAAVDNLGETPSAGAVDGWYVSLVGIDPAARRVLVRSHDGFAWTPSAGVLARFRGFPIVVAVIAHDNPDDLDSAAEQYAHYKLEVDGRTKDGG